MTFYHADKRVGEVAIGFSDFEAFKINERLVDDADAADGSTLGTLNEGFWISMPALFSVSVSCEHVNASDECEYAQWVWYLKKYKSVTTCSLQ